MCCLLLSQITSPCPPPKKTLLSNPEYLWAALSMIMWQMMIFNTDRGTEGKQPMCMKLHTDMIRRCSLVTSSVCHANKNPRNTQPIPVIAWKHPFSPLQTFCTEQQNKKISNKTKDNTEVIRGDWDTTKLYHTNPVIDTIWQKPRQRIWFELSNHMTEKNCVLLLGNGAVLACSG